MPDQYNLQRFLDAQQNDYTIALREIKNGRKRSHWMWYIFPQIKGLGFSSTSKYYAIQSAEEANAYLQHPVLGERLTEITRILLSLPGSNATAVFGSPDDMKLRSSMTLFASLSGADTVFKKVLEKFFDGKEDRATADMLTHAR